MIRNFWKNNRPPSTPSRPSTANTTSSVPVGEYLHIEALEEELNKLQLTNVGLISKYKATKIELHNSRTRINELESEIKLLASKELKSRSVADLLQRKYNVLVKCKHRGHVT